MKEAVWLELFGHYTKWHKANRGFFKWLRLLMKVELLLIYDDCR